MAVKMKIEGGGDIERALGQIARSASKAAMRRAMVKALQPVADDADAASPFTVKVTSKLSKRQERQARADRGRSKVTLYVGPVQPDGGDAPHAHLYEFGTGARVQKSTGKSVGVMPARPFMRPAWDAHRDQMLETLTREIWVEIERAAERARRKAAKAAS